MGVPNEQFSTSPWGFIWAITPARAVQAVWTYFSPLIRPFCQSTRKTMRGATGEGFLEPGPGCF